MYIHNEAVMGTAWLWLTFNIKTQLLNSNNGKGFVFKDAMTFTLRIDHRLSANC